MLSERVFLKCRIRVLIGWFAERGQAVRDQPVSFMEQRNAKRPIFSSYQKRVHGDYGRRTVDYPAACEPASHSNRYNRMNMNMSVRDENCRSLTISVENSIEIYSSIENNDLGPGGNSIRRPCV